MKLPVPKNEQERLTILSSYHIVEAEQDARLNELTKLAASMFDVPMAIITILDQSRQWFKAKYGLELRETSRDISFCQYTIMGSGIFEVPDSLEDKRFKDNPLVTGGPHIRFYAGAPLISREGYVLGSLGLLDNKPRKLDAKQKRTLKLLASQVVDHFELMRDKKELSATVQKRTCEIEQKLQELSLKDLRLKAANEELTRFMYKASHDLRGPLKTILGLLNLAQAEAGNEAITSYLQLLKRTQQRLDKTLDHLLTVVQVKTHDPLPEPVNLHQLVQKIQLKLSVEHKEKRVNIQCRPECKPQICTDPLLLEAALSQILQNSIQHNTSEEPTILIKIYRQGKSTKVEVTDNGSGIPAADFSQLFKMFFKNNSGGAGLGLYIVKCALELLQGEVKVERSDHTGTTFSMLLPDHL